MLCDESQGRDVNDPILKVSGGPMQIDPNSYKESLAGKNGLPPAGTGPNGAPTVPTDPATNILAGATYLQQLKAKFGSMPLALRAYNSGPNGVNPNSPDTAGTGGTTGYIAKVTDFANKLQNGDQFSA